MYTIFSYPIKTKYKNSFCSKATFFYLVTSVLTFIPPLLIAYRSQGFWQKTDTYQEQPDVHFEHELIVLMETADPEKNYGWSTMSNFNQLLDEKVQVPTLKSTETDWNRDGKLDYVDLTIEMPTFDNQPVYGVQLYLLFDVKFYKFSTVHMHGLVYVSTTSGLPTSGLTVQGDLAIVQKQPLAHRGIDRRFSTPLFNASSIFAEAFNLKKVVQEYGQRNVSMRLSNEYYMWERGVTGRGNPFIVNLRINYPVQTVTYYTGFWQMLKWGWVQYSSILFLFIAFFHEVKAFVFSKQVLPSVVCK